MIPHRSTTLIAVIVFVALLLFIFSSSSVQSSSSEPAVYGPARFIPKPKLPSFDLDNIRFPFRPAAHKPPEQPNSTSGESKWYTGWQWLNPFSSSVTLDEQRTVLPPLLDRTPVYTFYEPNEKNDDEEQEADRQLLLAWRRAWYAQGFHPVVLSRAEAMNNEYYEVVQRLKIDPALEIDLFKWLAWGNMGTGLLADWRCFPMARYDDQLLSYLRRGADPAHITRFEKLDGGLFAGEKARINDAIRQAVKAINERSKSVVELIPPDFFRVEQPSAFAFYHSSTITTHYAALAEKHVSSTTSGRLALTQLINAHLHTTFLNGFSSGIAVLKPLPEHTTALVEPAMRLAKALIQCPTSVLPASCPPNRPKCQPCSLSSKPISIFQPSAYKNTTNLFTIGTVPHPYTMTSLQHGADDITTRYIRRETPRDPWLVEVTEDLLGPERGGPSRVVVFKELVAGDTAIARSFWLTVENLSAQPGEDLPPTLLDEMEWQFGFRIPRDASKKPKVGQNKNPEEEKKPGETKSEEAKPKDITKPREESLQKEYDLIEKAREVLRSKDNNRVGIREVAEAWNLADSEVWRFVRAWRARSVLERQNWEEAEKNFIGVKT